MAFTQVDKIGDKIIRKLHSQDKSKTFGFLTLPVDYDGKDPSQVKQHATLAHAREHLGFTPKIQDVAFLTKPKSAYVQNQPGYVPTGKK
jgi:hypothetical protein